MDFQEGEDLLTQVQEIARDCECLRVLGGLSGAGFAGFIGIFRMGEDLLTQVRSYERWTRVCERLVGVFELVTLDDQRLR